MRIGWPGATLLALQLLLGALASGCLDPPPPSAPAAPGGERVHPLTAAEAARWQAQHERDEAAEDEMEKIALMKPAERERYLAKQRQALAARAKGPPATGDTVR
jgi:hypothetical protein